MIVSRQSISHSFVESMPTVVHRLSSWGTDAARKIKQTGLNYSRRRVRRSSDVVRFVLFMNKENTYTGQWEGTATGEESSLRA